MQLSNLLQNEISEDEMNNIKFQALTFDNDLHCSCGSLTVDECKSYDYEDCKVNGSECIAYTFACADLTQTECASYQYECKWDTSCVDYTYKCSDFSNDETKCSQYNCEWKNSSCADYDYTCSNFKTQESCPCLWNKSDVCEEFSKCENYTKDQCPDKDSYGCMTTDTGCIARVCSNIKVENDCGGDVNDETQCAWNNDGQCAELPSKSICTDLDDFKNLCTSSYSCKYVESSCIFKTCADLLLEECELNEAYISKNEYNLCTVSESKCIELTDTTKLTKDNCSYQSSHNYHWTKDGKCEECADLISYDSSSEIILGIMIMICLVA